MTYIDPETYNVDNLNGEDRAEAEYWTREMEGAVWNAIDVLEAEDAGCGRRLAKLLKEQHSRFARELESQWGYRVTDFCVSRIDSYPDGPEGGAE